MKYLNFAEKRKMHEAAFVIKSLLDKKLQRTLQASI